MASSLGSSNLLERLTKFKETLTHVDQFTMKGYDKGYRWTSRCQRRVGQGMWAAPRDFRALSWDNTFPALLRVHQPGSSPSSIPLGFYGGFLTQTWSIINSIFSPSPLSEKGRGCGAESPKLLMAWPFWWPREWRKVHEACWRAHLRSLALGPPSAPHCTGHQIPQALRDVYFCAL